MFRIRIEKALSEIILRALGGGDQSFFALAEVRRYRLSV